jgi:hypothetical protein
VAEDGAGVGGGGVESGRGPSCPTKKEHSFLEAKSGDFGLV